LELGFGIWNLEFGMELKPNIEPVLLAESLKVLDLSCNSSNFYLIDLIFALKNEISKGRKRAFLN